MKIHKVRAVAIQPIEMLRSMNGSNGEAALQNRVVLADSSLGRICCWISAGIETIERSAAPQ